jgi:hypothetical protein
MAKHGQHHNDGNDPDRSKGHNNPSQAQTITAGTPKKHETYQQQAREHKEVNRQPQAAKNTWNEDTRDEPSIEGSTRERDPRSGRSGSDSNASAGTRGH